MNARPSVFLRLSVRRAPRGLLVALLSANAAAAAPAPPQSGIEQVTVTASKIGQTRRAPTAITTVDAKAIEQLHIQTVEDAQATVPSLVYTDNGGSAQPFIRGIGTNFSYAGLESSVATYVDGVYLQRQVGAAVDVLDLQSLQVLKGPQGSLYGRNATGGVILVQTQDPQPKYGAELSAETGNLEHGKVSGVANLPLTDTLAVRVAAQWNQQGGYVTNHADDTKLGGDIHKLVRGKLAWTPTTDFKVIAGVQYDDDANRVVAQHETLAAPLCVACTIFGTQPPAASDFYGANFDPQPKTTSTSVAGSLRATYTAPGFDVAGVFGIRRQVYRIFVDQDYQLGDFLHTFAKEGGTTYTGDIYAKSHFDGPLNMLVGTSLEYDHDTLTAALYGAAVGPLQGLGNAATVTLKSVSGYAEAYYNVTTALRLTVGARYNIDSKQLDSVNNPFATLAFAAPAVFTENRTFRDFTPRAALTYAAGPMNYYVSVSRGAKSGGFNTPAFNPAPPLTSEKLTSYEIGLKADLLAHRLNFDTAFFYYDYKDIQVSFIDAKSGAVFGENAASATSYGLEGSASYRILPSLTLRAGGLVLHSRFDSFTAAAVFVPAAVGLANGAEDLSGTALARSPDFSGFLGFTDDFPLVAGWGGEFNALEHYAGRYLFVPGGGGPLEQDQQRATNLVTFSGTATSPNGRYELRFFINNAAGQKYFRDAQTSAEGAEYDAAEPLTYGVGLRVKF